MSKLARGTACRVFLSASTLLQPPAVRQMTAVDRVAAVGRAPMTITLFSTAKTIPGYCFYNELRLDARTTGAELSHLLGIIRIWDTARRAGAQPQPTDPYIHAFAGVGMPMLQRFTHGRADRFVWP